MIDMDAAKAAREEVQKKAPNLQFGGKQFTLPVELPYSVIEMVAKLEPAQKKGDAVEVGRVITEAVKLLLGKDASKFMALRPSMDDLEVLFEGLAREYGLGETSASGE